MMPTEHPGWLCVSMLLNKESTAIAWASQLSGFTWSQAGIAVQIAIKQIVTKPFIFFSSSFPG
jgi:hypothetical protein